MLYWSGCHESQLCSGEFNPECQCGAKPRRGVRVAEGARLESVFGGNLNVGSNPTLSATYRTVRGSASPYKIQKQMAAGKLAQASPVESERSPKSIAG
jgi:hypothetical protein